MRFINFIFINFLLICLVACGKKPVKDISEMLPEYKLINEFSKKIKPETDLVLCGYGINNYLPKGYEFKNEVANFNVSYTLNKTRQDAVILEDARRLLVSLAEALLITINSNSEISRRLETYPLSNDLLYISFYFQDENQIGLGSGVSEVFFSRGKIKYRRYEIEKYTNKYPAEGKHFIIHQETYAEALEIIKKQGSLISL